MLSIPVVMSPDANNKALRKAGKDEHAAPEHLRISAKPAQTSNIDHGPDHRCRRRDEDED